jgi:hypothetical protein
MILQQAERGQIKAKVVSIPDNAGEADPVGRAPGEYFGTIPRATTTGPSCAAGRRKHRRSALYQQAPEDGDYFKSGWFREYDILPDNLSCYAASDFAVTADGGDFTVHIVVGLDPANRMYVVDMYRAQASSHVALPINYRVAFSASDFAERLVYLSRPACRSAQDSHSRMTDASRRPQKRPSRLISGALTPPCTLFASLVAWVVVTEWPTLCSPHRLFCCLWLLFWSAIEYSWA